MASLLDPRRHVRILPERVKDVSSTDYPGHYANEDHSWNLEKFTENLQVEIQRLSQRSVEFDLVGVDASIANAIRRIMIAEVPTIAIENVYVFDNTSVVVDEVLAHRLGLVPLNVDPNFVQWRNDQSPNDRNTIVFRLNVHCTRAKSAAGSKKSKLNPNAVPESTDPHDLYINSDVLSSHLEWEPQGEQLDAIFANIPDDKKPAPTNPNIVLAKLRPGQSVEMELHAVKGVGKDHAKFSPVATASYRLLPLIILNPSNPIPPEHALKFQSCFSPGVIDVDPDTKEVSVNEKGLRNDTVSREVLRHPEFAGKVELKRVRDYFLFNVETESAYTPERLPMEAIKIMREKLHTIKEATLALLEDADSGANADVQMSEA